MRIGRRRTTQTHNVNIWWNNLELYVINPSACQWSSNMILLLAPSIVHSCPQLILQPITHRILLLFLPQFPPWFPLSTLHHFSRFYVFIPHPAGLDNSRHIRFKKDTSTMKLIHYWSIQTLLTGNLLISNSPRSSHHRPSASELYAIHNETYFIRSPLSLLFITSFPLYDRKCN